jgi:hypothetical protein
MASTRRRQPEPAERPATLTARWNRYRLLIALLMGCWAERLGLYLFGVRNIPPFADIALLVATCVLAGFVYLAAARLRNELSRSR